MLSYRLDQLHARAKGNKWLRYFSVFNRIALAAGFIPSGFVKIMGERFTSLSNNHPMGHYLEALHHTGYYYTFIGVLQVTAAILLLIPRTAVLGALLYFPIILNICILSFAVRFDGSLLSSPLMVLANLYLICWNYDKIKYILPFYEPASANQPPVKPVISEKFPVRFFAGVFATVVIVAAVVGNLYSIRPRNTLAECNAQCANSKNPGACNIFCDCIHQKGKPLDKCLDEYNKALKSGGK
ncbi:DoxX family protein [Mucilaginibacter sp. AK015]|uniref:DoxX family protein n=1 Tax=Mucilaginibacter sp. AK015 TaxID=2723072 RepID=UPI001622E6BF|nr:DoxX family protein [Mucilaginibacter sp. AK015]MBB5395690.1 putative membrane protein YphA (DoxX/SURF4 family) [Mucilaginibacter sp. AK015]